MRTLYSECRSIACVNGLMSASFVIERLVRQWCPLSMLLQVLFQETLYLAVMGSALVVPPSLPNSMNLLVIGYADDTKVFVSDEACVLAVEDVLDLFEKATGAAINREKTSVMGLSVGLLRLTEMVLVFDFFLFICKPK